jgi:ABC-2 type transport system permease protein
MTLLALVLVAPLLLLLLVGNIRVNEPTVRVALVGEGADEVKRRLDDLDGVTAVHWPQDSPDMPRRAERERVDLLIVSRSDLLGVMHGQWVYYTFHTDPYRLRYVSAVVEHLVAAGKVQSEARDTLKDLDILASSLAALSPAPPPDSGASAEDQASPDASSQDKPTRRDREQTPEGRAENVLERLRDKAQALTHVPVPILTTVAANRFTRYFPAVSPVDRSLVPKVVALITIFLPFLLASAALVRERENGMLGPVIVATQRNWRALLIGKLLMPMTVTLLMLLVQLLIIASVFEYGTKPNLLEMIALQLVAATASALLGLTVSSYVRSQQQAFVVSAVYLLCLILLTGFVYPLEQANIAVQVVSYMLPLTFSAPLFEAWITRGSSVFQLDRESLMVFVQASMAGLLTYAAMKSFRRRL